MSSIVVSEALRRTLDRPAHRPVTLDELEVDWNEYVRLAGIAQSSGLLADGIAAGQAWGRFVRRFEHWGSR